MAARAIKTRQAERAECDQRLARAREFWSGGEALRDLGEAPNIIAAIYVLTWTSLVPCDVGDEGVGGVWYVGFGGELVAGDFDGDVA